jgi:hypothetical protein
LGRHKEEPRERFTLRIKETELAELDAWMVRQGEVGFNRQKAILRLVSNGIRDVNNSPVASPASEIAQTLQARITELEAELQRCNAEREAELQRGLAELEDGPARPSLLDKISLSPEARAKFDRVCAQRGKTAEELIAIWLEKSLLPPAAQTASPAPTPPAPAAHRTSELAGLTADEKIARAAAKSKEAKAANRELHR